MTRQNQIIAIEKGARGEAEGMITRAYHVLQKTVLLNGIARSYIPQAEDGDQLPPERKLAQVLRVSRPSLREALRARATIGEICGVLREEFGTFDAQLSALP